MSPTGAEVRVCRPCHFCCLGQAAHQIDGDRLRDDDHAVVVTHHQIARPDPSLTAHNRGTEYTVTLGERSRRDARDCEHREPKPLDLRHVANGAVDNEAGYASLLGG